MLVGVADRFDALRVCLSQAMAIRDPIKSWEPLYLIEFVAGFLSTCIWKGTHIAVVDQVVTTSHLWYQLARVIFRSVAVLCSSSTPIFTFDKVDDGLTELFILM